MSGFSADWLALREPFDVAARAASLIAALRAHVTTAQLEIIDLGAGAGSNLRYLGPLLGGAQRWRLVDHDPRLLDAGIAATHTWAEERGADVRRTGSALAIRAADFAAEVQCEPADLTELDALELPVAGLVTAAALLDLVSQSWLDGLAQRCRAANAAIHFALTYDGRAEFTPGDAGDAEVLALFNRHQLGDKGFGPALGPQAAATASTSFAARGYQLQTQASDWTIEPQEHALQLALLEGWRTAASEIAPQRRAALERWHARRREHVVASQSLLRVGHTDLVGWL